jgi:hypothetical protein
MGVEGFDGVGIGARVGGGWEGLYLEDHVDCIACLGYHYKENICKPPGC